MSLAMNAVKKPYDRICSRCDEQSLGGLHNRARGTRAMRGEATLVAQFTDALDSGVQSVQCLQ